MGEAYKLTEDGEIMVNNTSTFVPHPKGTYKAIAAYVTAPLIMKFGPVVKIIWITDAKMEDGRNFSIVSEPFGIKTAPGTKLGNLVRKLMGDKFPKADEWPLRKTVVGVLRAEIDVIHKKDGDKVYSNIVNYEPSANDLKIPEDYTPPEWAVKGGERDTPTESADALPF